MVVRSAEALGGRADLVDRGALVGPDDLALVEEDDGKRDVLHHRGQIRWQSVGAIAFDALRLVDDEGTCLLCGAAQGADAGEQFAGCAMAAHGLLEVGAQGSRGCDEAGMRRGVVAHEAAEESHGEGGLAAARAAAHGDDRTVSLAHRFFAAGGQMVGGHGADPYERVLLVAHQSEGVGALQL